MPTLAAWQNFYVIVGSSASALTGLQFVVMALLADLPVTQASVQTADAFGTPTIVHFGAVLLLSGIMSAPWHGPHAVAVLLALVGLIGFVYVLIVARRARRQTVYAPVFEDWLFHALLPALAYGVWCVAGWAVHDRAEHALFALAAVSLLLLFVGIHNAWDTVTYMVFVRAKRQDKDPP
jgi:hypothetical protein